MQFSHKWIQEYFEEPLPEIKDLAEILTFHAFEIDSIGPNLTDGKGEDLIDIDVLPNRSHDCFCYSGIAKEISVLTGLKMKEWDDVVDPPAGEEKGLKSSDFISLVVEDFNLVPRATKRLVQNVKIEASPDWLRKKLESIGQKSINNLVDITNFVMWETGQPVHAFDFDKVAGDKTKEFIIRNAEAEEKITTLDGQNFELDESVIVIADKEKALDIAGTKGGIVSGIDENTKNVVLSVCNFNQTSIRKTSRKLGLRTDASVRFENGISPEKVGEAMERLTKLVVEITGGKASEDVLDVYPRKANLFKVGVSTQEANRLLGTNLSDDEVENIFKRFGFESCLPAGRLEKVSPIDKVLGLVSNLIDVPYKSGASVSYDAPNLFDCSSLTAYLFAQAGIRIPRISVDQYLFGNPVSKLDLKAGDLVFANTGLIKETGIHIKTVEFLPGTEVPEGVDHVGLYLGENKVLHTSSEIGKSVIEVLDEAEMFKNIVGYRRMVNSLTNADGTQKNAESNERYVVTIPHERLDLRIKEDLIEELGRVYGYRNIKSVVPNLSDGQGKIFEPKINKTFYYINKIKNILIDVGFDEVSTYTFGEKGNVEVQKPLASNLGKLRNNLSDGIEKSLELNVKNAPVLGLDEIKIFEIGKVFPDIDGEYFALAIGVEVAKKTKNSVSVKDEIIQKAVELLQKTLQTNNIDLDASRPSGVGGIFEVNLDKLIESLPDPELYEDVLGLDLRETILFKKISQYPFMLRDIAVFVPNENSADDVLEIIKENAGDLLVRTKLFDTYSPEEGDKTSYAFNLVFQSQKKTLTDEEINVIMDKITTQITSKNWEVR